ncbi:MAG TPA: GNAT family N-acetyltransferase [Vicinamibacterales bacterium]|nr:GNAT family N-acetyltransferase [Vicinamibacterales bacterium]
MSETGGEVLESATPADAAAVAALLTAAAAKLTAKYGPGHWSRPSTERGILVAMRVSRVFIMRRGDRAVATLALAAKKPWVVDLAYFTPSRRAVYLQSMAVEPELQRCGIGRRCVDQALQIARDWRAETVRLDAYDADAGAGGFYLACGFRQAGRVVYRSVPLVYFERML